MSYIQISNRRHIICYYIPVVFKKKKKSVCHQFARKKISLFSCWTRSRFKNTCTIEEQVQNHIDSVLNILCYYRNIISFRCFCRVYALFTDKLLIIATYMSAIITLHYSRNYTETHSVSTIGKTASKYLTS